MTIVCRLTALQSQGSVSMANSSQSSSSNKKRLSSNQQPEQHAQESSSRKWQHWFIKPFVRVDSQDGPDLRTNSAAAVQAFDHDVINNGGYRYTTNAQLSSDLSNQRIIQATQQATSFRNRSVIDIGCGDGTFSMALYDNDGPARLVAIDPAAEAIEIAKNNRGNRPIDFQVQSAYELNFPDNTFDVAQFRGVLHHLERPADAIREALRVAKEIVVMEPNGYNPVLKLIEKYSTYHIEHGEKSYAPSALDAWVRQANATLKYRSFVGLVPFFCPNWFARTLKFFEPIVEVTPIIKHIACGQYIFSAVRNDVAYNENTEPSVIKVFSPYAEAEATKSKENRRKAA
jgi:ubiquinone/menaquinone biosynthesis C-methylase UbiE